MPQNKRWMVLALAMAGPALLGCNETAESASPATVPAETVDVDGSEVPMVKLSERAAERLGIELAPVATENGVRVIPYAAVVYEPDGNAWAYVSPEAFTYRRSPIEIWTIDGDRVVLTSGLDEATEVVTVGTAELFGVEQGIGS